MITFLGLPERTAGLIRGRQISERISDSEFLHVNSHQTARNKICIFVRNHFSESAKFYKSKGHLIGYDICDMPAGDIYNGKLGLSMKNYCHDIYDFFIVNNQTAYNEAKAVTDRPIYVIPHHTVNFENKKIDIKSQVKAVGYVGLKEQFSQSENFQSFLKDKNIEFISVHPNTREECDKVFQSIDVGVIFLDTSSANESFMSAVKKYKPNTKLSNFQSYGIPTVCIGYDSYKQFGESAFIEINSYENMINAISSLINSTYLRSELSEKSYHVGQKFHINNVIKMYTQVTK